MPRLPAHLPREPNEHLPTECDRKLRAQLLYSFWATVFTPRNSDSTADLPDGLSACLMHVWIARDAFAYLAKSSSRSLRLIT
jgi:hypothetical protein